MHGACMEPMHGCLGPIWSQQLAWSLEPIWSLGGCCMEPGAYMEPVACMEPRGMDGASLGPENLGLHGLCQHSYND